MNYNQLSINERVTILRQIAISLSEKKLTIPENEEGIIYGYYNAERLLYFIADMLEE